MKERRVDGTYVAELRRRGSENDLERWLGESSQDEWGIGRNEALLSVEVV